MVSREGRRMMSYTELNELIRLLYKLQYPDHMSQEDLGAIQKVIRMAQKEIAVPAGRGKDEQTS
jgi:hypothetical protein